MEFSIEQALIDEYIRLRQEDLLKSKEFYFRELMPRLRPWLEAQENHVRLRNEKFDTLVSLMGFSPETTVTCALILRPKKLVVAYSKQAEDTFNVGMDYLLNERILRPADIRACDVDGFDPKDIYSKLLQVIPSTGKRVFDVTGGTKLMSATAGYLAWEQGYSLCYLDGTWDPKFGAAGLARTSVLKFYSTPSQQKGHEIRSNALRFYLRGNFVASWESFEDSKRRIDDYVFEDFGIALCRCYAALADLNRDQLKKDLVSLEDTLSRAGVRRLFEGRLSMEDHIQAMRLVAEGEQTAMAAAFLELAEVYRRQSRHDFASLLIYRAMEAIVEIGLHQINEKFDLGHPDYSLLELTDVEQRCKEISGERYRGLPPSIGLEAGFTLLVLKDRVDRSLFGDISDKNLVGRIQGYATKRNQSILAHGNRMLTAEDSENLLVGASEVAQAVLRDRFDEFKQLRERLRPRPLTEILPA